MSAIFGETLTFGQASDPDIRLRVTGDEYRAIYEAPNGYTAAHDTDRNPSNGLLKGRRLSTGTVRGLTILVECKDVRATVTRPDVDELLNAPNDTRNDDSCSAREYFRIVSAGRLDCPADLSTGTLCDQNGALLCRFPDMHDYGDVNRDGAKSAGIGSHRLMGSGNHLDFSLVIADICAGVASCLRAIFDITHNLSDRFDSEAILAYGPQRGLTGPVQPRAGRPQSNLRLRGAAVSLDATGSNRSEARP